MIPRGMRVAVDDGTIMDAVFYFPPEYLRAGLLVSLLSVWLLVALFAYLNHYTRRRYFTMWTAAWLFYALWLTLTLSQEVGGYHSLSQMARQWCVGISAVFLFWGSLVFLGHQVSQRLLGLFMVFLLAWSYVGTYHMPQPVQAQWPIFLMMGVASLRAAHCFFSYRLKRNYLGASLIAIGLVLWGVYLAGVPFWETQRHLRAASYFISGVIQLHIAVSMIVLVLEEARATLQRMIRHNRNSLQACVGLQQQVRSSEDRYRKLFEQASDAIVITDTSRLGILELNQRARRLLLRGAPPPGDHSLFAYLERQPACCGCDPGPQLFESIRNNPTLHLVAADGSKTPVEAEAIAIEFDGRLAYQFAFRELTERVRLEQQLRQSEKLSALGQMISGIAHELNNPLAVIKGYLELVLQHHPLPQHTRRDLQAAANESNRAARLVSNFLSFAREQPVSRKPADLHRLIENVLELRRFDLRAAGIEVSLDLAPDLPRLVLDADQIERVLINLITNAIHAIEGQDRPGVLRFRTSRVNGVVRLLVEDNGPGVPKAIESRIFEPFFTTKEVGKGTGLGLSIAHSILREHKGRIYYQPSALGGACFVLEFPVSTPEATFVPEMKSSSRAEPELPVPKGARILILDDEQALADMLGQIVRHLGHQATLCYSPMEALKRIETEEFDLVLSDYRMPVLDGRQFYSRVRQMRPRLADDIIFLTGDVVNEETQNFLAAVGNTHLHKPFQIQKVRDAINERLRQLVGARAGNECAAARSN